MFTWQWNIDETDWVNYCSMAENNMLAPDDVIGCARTGDVCVDVTVFIPDDTSTRRKA